MRKARLSQGQQWQLRCAAQLRWDRCSPGACLIPRSAGAMAGGVGKEGEEKARKGSFC